MQKIEQVRIAVDGDALRGEMTTPQVRMPGILLVHGWDSDAAHYRRPAEHLAELGFVCLAFDMRGHGEDDANSEAVSREDNLRDVIAAFDRLASNPCVDRGSIGVVGTSYGGYLAAIASTRGVRWLALRVPALYPDSDWQRPKASLDREALMKYRRVVRAPEGNRALSACEAFRGDALVVGSSEDDVIPEETIRSYVLAFRRARSLTHRSIDGADHGLSDERSREQYGAILQSWFLERLREMRSP